MTLNITSKQMEITPAIREHVEGRLAKLEKWHTQLISPHFVLSKVPNGFSVEASIGTPLGNLWLTDYLMEFQLKPLRKSRSVLYLKQSVG